MYAGTHDANTARGYVSSLRAKAGTTAARRRFGKGVEHGAEFAGGESVESTKASSELNRGEAAFTVEAAKKVSGGRFAFKRLAFHASGHEVAIQVLATLSAGDDVVQAADSLIETAEAIEAKAALTSMDGLAKGTVLEKVGPLQARSQGFCRDPVRCGASTNAIATSKGLLWITADIHKFI